MLILLGLILGLAVYNICQASGINYEASVCAGVGVICVIWWIFEPIPIPITSLIPIAMFPMLGLLDGSQVSDAYGSPLILLLLGGFLLSKSMESSNAHKQIALLVVRALGTHSAKRLVFGVMVATAILSMWISNTATVLMLLPVVLAILEKDENKKLAVPLLLGLAYGASIGGMGTPIGTPPNIIMMHAYEDFTGEAIPFTTWMSWAVPVVIILIPIVALWLTRSLGDEKGIEIPHPGPWTPAAKRVLIVFVLTAIAWVTRTSPFGGWGQWLGHANDAAVAFSAVIILFMIPNGEGGRLLNWKQASTIPWGILLLFAGGLTLAKGFQVSGLSAIMGEAMGSWVHLPLMLMLFLLALGVSFLTEATSNTASTVVLMPILAVIATAENISPEYLMVTATLSASCAFMMPVATAPNAIVYATNQFTVTRMVREGLILNLIGAVIISLWCYWRLG